MAATPTPASPPKKVSLGGILRLRCPACWTGAMFANPLKMHPRCPHCDYVFDRGNGYFIGAMYSSYLLSLGVATVVGTSLFLLGWEVWPIVGACAVAVSVAGPLAIFPYSRVLWVWAESDGWLHDGQEDVATLRQRHLERARGKTQTPGPE